MFKKQYIENQQQLQHLGGPVDNRNLDYSDNKCNNNDISFQNNSASFPQENYDNQRPELTMEDLKGQQLFREQHKPVDTATFEHQRLDYQPQGYPSSSFSSHDESQQKNSLNRYKYNSHTKQMSIESDFDLSTSKLQRLGLNAQEPSSGIPGYSIDPEEINQDQREYSNLLKNYSKQFNNPIIGCCNVNNNTQGNNCSNNSPMFNDYSTSTRMSSQINTALRSRDNSRMLEKKYGPFLNNNQATGAGTGPGTYVGGVGKAGFGEVNKKNYGFNKVEQPSDLDISSQQYTHSYNAPPSSTNDTALNILSNQQSSSKERSPNSQKQQPNQSQQPEMSIRDKMQHFQKKLEEAQEDFSSSKNTLDPYKISLYSINDLTSIKKDLDSTNKKNLGHGESSNSNPFGEKTNFHNNQSNTNQAQGISSLGSSINNAQQVRKPPLCANLSKAFGDEENMKRTFHTRAQSYGQKSGITDNFELRRIKFYDSLLPDNMKIMNSPFKLMKYKIYSRDKNSLQNCMSDLNYINNEINSNLFDTTKLLFA